MDESHIEDRPTIVLESMTTFPYEDGEYLVVCGNKVHMGRYVQERDLFSIKGGCIPADDVDWWSVAEIV